MPDDEKTVDSSIILDMLELDIRDWRALAGSYSFSEPQGGSFCVSHMHNPVDLVQLKIKPMEGSSFEIDATLKFFFEYEGAGYQDEVTRLLFSANYEGFHFRVPTWGEPHEVQFPVEWRVPSSEPTWTDEEILGFVSLYADLSDHHPLHIENGNFLRAEPKLNA